jgi:thiol-disulfide isomerase/thioredoxin
VKEFPGEHVWFNSGPLQWGKELKNKLVLIDFWTYCCINCLHVLPDIEYLETKFANEHSIAFLGCHSAKFLNEKGSSKVRDAILRYDVKHPVINDDKMIVWRDFERRSWPGLIIVSPRGVPILIMNGEGYRDVMDLFLSIAFDFYYDKMNHQATIQIELEEQKASAQKKAKLNSLEQRPEEAKASTSNLKYPGKLLCIEK